MRTTQSATIPAVGHFWGNTPRPKDATAAKLREAEQDLCKVARSWARKRFPALWQFHVREEFAQDLAGFGLAYLRQPSTQENAKQTWVRTGLLILQALRAASYKMRRAGHFGHPAPKAYRADIMQNRRRVAPELWRAKRWRCRGSEHAPLEQVPAECSEPQTAAAAHDLLADCTPAQRRAGLALIAARGDCHQAAEETGYSLATMHQYKHKLRRILGAGRSNRGPHRTN